MRIGLISDTHVPEVEKEMPARILEVFAGVDLILHGGDIYAPSVLDALERLAPVLAALGDDDYAKGDRRVKEGHVLDLAGKTLWLTHVGPFRFSDGEWLSRDGVMENHAEAKPDVVVFGHEHRAFVHRDNGTLYVNPGSPTLQNDHGSIYKPYRRGLGTVGILEIGAGWADARIVQL